MMHKNINDTNRYEDVPSDDCFDALGIENTTPSESESGNVGKSERAQLLKTAIAMSFCYRKQLPKELKNGLSDKSHRSINDTMLWL